MFNELFYANYDLALICLHCMPQGTFYSFIRLKVLFIHLLQMYLTVFIYFSAFKKFLFSFLRNFTIASLGLTFHILIIL